MRTWRPLNDRSTAPAGGGSLSKTGELLARAAQAGKAQKSREAAFAAGAEFSDVSKPRGAGSSSARGGGNVSYEQKLRTRASRYEGMTKKEKLARRKASMTAGDSWEDLHGTKSKPEREHFRGNLAAGLSSRRQAEGGTGKGKAKAEVVVEQEEEEEWEDEGEEDEEPPPPPPSSLVRRVSQRV